MYLVVDDELQRLVFALQQHQLVGLPGHGVGQRGAQAGVQRAQPEADGEGMEHRDGGSHQGVRRASAPRREGQADTARGDRVCVS